MGSVSVLILAELQQEMRGFVLLAAVLQVSQAAPQFLPYAIHPYAVHSAAVVTGNAVPVSVGGYKAVAGSNGDLAGPVHEVPGLVPALAVQKQESSGDVSLSTGTGALVPTVGVYYGKRSADPQLVYGHPYAYGAYPYVLPALKPLTLKTDVTATNLPVPVSVGGYKAEAGNNGELKGAVHEVPGLLKQENSDGGALTVGTSAVITHTLSKREAEADPAVLYSTVGYSHPAYHVPVTHYTYGG